MEQYPGSYYQPLFDYIHDQHGTLLLESECQEIIEIVNKMQATQPPSNTAVEEETVPDLSAATDQEKADFINGLIKIASREILKVFVMLGLKSHIETTVVNEATGDAFLFSFRKKGAASTPQGAADPEALTIADYEEVLADHRRLVRELDTIINGENAAKQASLCDMVKQLENEWPKRRGAVWVNGVKWPEGRHNEVHWRTVRDKHPVLVVGRNHVDNIVAQFGKVYLPSDLEYLDESGLQFTQGDAVWVKGDYERLYHQIKSGKRTVCFIDYTPFGQDKTFRDICTIRAETMEFTSRGHGYGGGKYQDAVYEKKEFLEECKKLNVEWLDESPSNQSDAVEFLDYLQKHGFYLSLIYSNEQLYDQFKNQP
jgi:hypothetical protein